MFDSRNEAYESLMVSIADIMWGLNSEESQNDAQDALDYIMLNEEN